MEWRRWPRVQLNERGKVWREAIQACKMNDSDAEEREVKGGEGGESTCNH